MTDWDTSPGMVMSGVLLFLGLAIGVIWFITSSQASSRRWNAWNQDCTKNHGVVSMVKKHWYGEEYECFVDGNILTLPGWEQYSSGVKN